MIIILCCFNFEKRTPRENHKGGKHPSHRVLNAKIHPYIHEPRTLDNELRTQVKLGLHNGAFQVAGSRVCLIFCKKYIIHFVIIQGKGLTQTSIGRRWGSSWKHVANSRKIMWYQLSLQWTMRGKLLCKRPTISFVPTWQTTSACRISSWQQLRWTPQGLAQSLFTAWRLRDIEISIGHLI